ncbi:ion channel [Singulisphaera acidiphila]
MSIVLTAVFVDGVALALGAIGYRALDGLDWLDASLNAALVMTGNGPVHALRTPGSKLFTVVYALLGVILFAAVIGVLLTPVLHRMLHGFEFHHREKAEQTSVGADDHHWKSAGGTK